MFEHSKKSKSLVQGIFNQEDFEKYLEESLQELEEDLEKNLEESLQKLEEDLEEVFQKLRVKARKQQFGNPVHKDEVKDELLEQVKARLRNDYDFGAKVLELIPSSKLNQSTVRTFIEYYFVGLDSRSPEAKKWLRARRDSLNTYNLD